jgi:hypothetical protein
MPCSSWAKERPVCKFFTKPPEGRGSESRPVHHLMEPDHCLAKSLGMIISYGLWAKGRRYRRSTVEASARALKSVARHADLRDHYQVREYLASANCSENRKERLVIDLLSSVIVRALEPQRDFAKSRRTSSSYTLLDPYVALIGGPAYAIEYPVFSSDLSNRRCVSCCDRSAGTARTTVYLREN